MYASNSSSLILHILLYWIIIYSKLGLISFCLAMSSQSHKNISGVPCLVMDGKDPHNRNKGRYIVLRLFSYSQMVAKQASKQDMLYRFCHSLTNWIREELSKLLLFFHYIITCSQSLLLEEMKV